MSDTTKGRALLAHIAGPCDDGDIALMLCGYVRPAQQPTSPDQPACQACAAVILDDRNALNRSVDRVRALHQPFEWSFGFGPVKSCKECARLGASEADAQHPCPTVRALDGES